MKVVWGNIFTYLKHSAFLIVLLSILAQPILQSICYLIDTDIELVQLDLEEDSDEKERQEKIEFQTQIIYNRYADCTLKYANYPKQEIICDFSLEIVVPPPEYS